MSDTGPRIRASVAADGDAIAAIYAHEVREGLGTFELEPPDTAEMLRRRAGLVEAGFPHLVAEIDGAVAGYAYAGPFRPRPAYRFSVEDSVYVADWARRRGVGRTLLGALIEACAAHDTRQMVAMISDTSGGSVALHDACGFARAGVLPAVGRKFDRWVDVVVMQRALGPGASTPPTGGA